jgi:hypothetical protein
MFAWKDFFDFECAVIDDALCLFATNDMGTFLYLPPLADKPKAGVVEKCFAVMTERNQGRGVSRVDNVADRQLAFFPSALYASAFKAHEYYYDKDAIAHLRGNALKAKRNACNYFRKHYRYAYRPYEDAMFEECAALYDEWARAREAKYPDAIYRQMLMENKRVHAEVIRNYDMLGMTGRVVLIDGKVKGYTFGFPLNDEVFCSYLEIADLQVRGLAVYIFRELCADPALKKNTFINAMDDFCMDNIKRVKLSFKPTMLMPSYVVTRRCNEGRGM